jgi:hypothetical protein
MKSPDLVGKEFGELLVLERDYEYTLKMAQKRGYWKCLCRCCNKIIIASTSALHSGKKLSCKTNYLEKGEAGFNFLFRNYKSAAKRRNLEFDLTKEEFKKLTKSDCIYCGSHPNHIHRKEKDEYIYNGVDRTDNSKGYIISNSVPCCETCNMAKRKMTQTEFIFWIKKVYRNLEKKEI